MTRTGFLLAKLLTSFGIAPLEKYRMSAAFEAHLMRDAEVIIGELAWDNLESVEDVSTEYWKLRKLTKKHDELEEKIESLEIQLDDSQEARARALEDVAEATKDKVEARDKVADSIDRLHQEREDIQKDGRSVKRAHSGLKTKLEFLLEESDGEMTPEASATQQELKLKRIQFEKIKDRRNVIDGRITELQKDLHALNEEIEKENKIIRERAEGQFGKIGKINKELTSLSNLLGAIDTERTELCSEVGKFIIQNAKDPQIREAVKSHRGLLSLIEEVRASTFRHRKVIGH
ncbi:hypothetical protein [Roseibacillus persicicus]|nr:hypothetical protein [Roseibacillus persicicus]